MKTQINCKLMIEILFHFGKELERRDAIMRGSLEKQQPLINVFLKKKECYSCDCPKHVLYTREQKGYLELVCKSCIN